MSLFYAARHGLTQANVEGRRAGMTDVPLLPEGRVQARRLGARLPGLGVARLLASPIERALETARIAAEVSGLAMEVDDRLREVDPGPWSGLTHEEVRRRWPDAAAVWESRPSDFSLEGHERLASVRDRMLEVVADVVAAGDVVLCVTHLDPIRALWAELACGDLDRLHSLPSGEYCVPIRFERRSGRWEVRVVRREAP